jgi:hypothetical protein
MLILDKPRVFDGQSVNIPLYHRGHLSLFPGAKVWLCLLPSGLGSDIFPELVISPIHFDSWEHLYRIRVTLKERPGLVHDLFEVLRQRSINILAAESSSMEWQSLHSIEVIVDTRRYSDKNGYDGRADQRSGGVDEVDDLHRLRRTILIRMMEDMCFDQSERPRLGIRSIRNLLEARRAFSKAQALGRLGGFEPVVDDVTISRRSGETVFITLPTGIRRTLLQALGAGMQRKNPAYGKYLLVSDTTDRFLRSFFMRESDAIIFPTLLHKEEVGALAAITGAIEKAGFNIITSLSRLYEHGTAAQSEFVLQPVGEAQKNASTGNLRAQLEEALSTPDIIDRYGVRIAYPKGYKTPPKAKPPVLLKGTAVPSEEQPQESVEAQLGRLQQVYHQRYRRPGATELDRMRFTLVSSLFAESEPRGATKKIPLFVSYTFKDEGRFSRIQNSARGMGFLVTTGKQLGADLTNRDGVRRLMGQCTHFLGVWSEDGGVRVNEKQGLWWPSPWLHWELGVAESLGLRWRLLISDTIEPTAWQKLVHNTPHEIFSRTDFDGKFREALRILKTVN